MRLLGAILAGGRATRFGSDKALALLDGMPLIEHAAALLEASVGQVVVCGRTAAPAGYIAIPDRPAPDLGPLGGLCGALHYAAHEGFDAVLTLGCDTPLLPGDTLPHLIAGRGACHLAQAPIIGRWPADLAEPLARHLASGGDRSVRRWAAVIGATAIDAGAPVPNFNRPADLARFAEARRGG